MPTTPLIPPVKTTTKGGMQATIFEIDPDDLQDGLNGIVYTPAMGDKPKSWSDVGICSNADDGWNLDPHAAGVKEAIEALHSARNR